MTRRCTAQLRKLNNNLVRDTMLARDAWTKETLAAATGLSQSTCHNILMAMLKSGEVAELPLAAPDGGRPARRFRYCREHVLFALVLLQCEKHQKSISVIIADTGGEILQQEKRFAETVTPDLLFRMTAAAIKDYPSVKAIGISYPGVVLNGKTSCWSDMEELSGIDLAAKLRMHFSLPFVIENDVNLATWGYAGKHEKETSCLAYIAFPPGGSLPGCGLVLDGRLFRGYRGFAGEVLYIQNQSWQEQRKKMNSPHGAAEMVLQMLRPVTALLDPERIVVAGGNIQQSDIRYIQEKCGSMVRSDFLPRLFFQPDYSPDNFSGLLDLVRKKLHSELTG